MQNGHQTYTKEFKMESAKLVQTSGKSMSKVAEEIGVSDSSLSRWCRQYGVHGEQAFPGSGHQVPEQEEIRRLKRELEVVRMERDVLKKSSYSISQLMSERGGGWIN
ncbi:MAG: transposase [Ktedonobacteraceae bacterium]|nr:transposase [Ktedonobacteraceae bacterium]